MSNEAIIAKHGKHSSDTGSAEVQIAILEEKIAYLQKHCNIHKKDKSSIRGFKAIVSNKRRLLKYLSSKKQTTTSNK